jgi:hypothetical protein
MRTKYIRPTLRVYRRFTEALLCLLDRLEPPQMGLVPDEVWLPLDALRCPEPEVAELPLQDISDIVGLDGLASAIPGRISGKADNRVDEIVNDIEDELLRQRIDRSGGIDLVEQIGYCVFARHVGLGAHKHLQRVALPRLAIRCAVHDNVRDDTGFFTE